MRSATVPTGHTRLKRPCGATVDPPTLGATQGLALNLDNTSKVFTDTNNREEHRMAIIEQQLAEQLVDLRAQQALGTEYAPIAELIACAQRHLDREQELRARIGELHAQNETLRKQATYDMNGDHRAVRTVEGAEMTNQGSDA